jgi:ubiquinone/menaquinone biosynthesis C-methylase UbiE
MINKNFLGIIECIKCKGSLLLDKDNLICKKCKIIYPLYKGIPQMEITHSGEDINLSKKSWDRIYKEMNNEKEDDQSVSHTKFLDKHLENFPSKGILLDLGCGIAKTTLNLDKKGISVIGIDISLEALIRSKKLFSKYKKEGEFIQANFLKIPLKNNSVDYIYWGLAIEYVEDINQAVKESFRVLKKGGYILVPFPVVSIPNLTYQQLRGDIPRVPILREISRFVHMNVLKGRYMHFGYGQTLSNSYIQKVFKKVGFKKINIGYFDTFYPVEFAPEIMRSFFRHILKFRPFWPFAYVKAQK